MTLQDAVAELISQHEIYGTITELDLMHIIESHDDDDLYMGEAIATILNAVVKGELK